MGEIGIIHQLFSEVPNRKPSSEKLEREKKEEKLIGKWVRRPGLRLFEYNLEKETLREATVNKKEVVHFVVLKKELIPKEEAKEKLRVQRACIYFEALNQMRNNM